MTFAPPTLKALAAYWVAQGGVNLGIVGDTAHITKGTSYHLGKDDLLAGAYSVQLARDKAGLSLAASAIDLGKLDGTLKELRLFSEWLVGQAKAGKTKDIREIIYCTADGQYINRWDGPTNRVIVSMKKTSAGWTVVNAGNGDATHASHTHISYYRDSEFREKVSVFQPYFEAEMAGLQVNLNVTHDPNPYDALGTAKLPTSVSVRRVQDDARIPLPTGTDLGVVQLGTLNGSSVVVFNHDSGRGAELHLTGKGQVTFAPLPPPSGGAPSAETCKPYTDPLNAQIAQLEQQVTTAKLDGAREEWERQEAGATVDVKLLPKP